MFARILVVVDRSSEAASALVVAVTFARAFRASLSACLLGTGKEAPLGPEVVAPYAALLGEPISTVVASGERTVEVARVARACRAELIVVGRLERSVIGRWLFGTATEALLESTGIPVLVARSGEPSGPVLAASELANGAFPAIRVAATIASVLGRELVVAHAVGRSLVSRTGLVRTEGTTSERALSARRWLQHALVKLRSHADQVVLEGRPDVAIPEFAARAGVSLVVVSTHRRKGVRGALRRSVAAAIARRAGCSVLVVSERVHSPR
ncbi:MAG: universal stress protein [Myxococcales bacterium]|nr:universal stress protein [Myxococcales bacterium]